MSAPRGFRPIAIGLAAVAGLSACSDDQPVPLPESAELMQIPSGEAELDAAVFNAGNPTAIVISHGATGRRDDFYAIAEGFAEQGWFAVAYDGRSKHRPDDLRATVAWVREQGAQAVVLLGGSYGACVSVTNAQSVDARAVIGLSTAPECDADAVAAAGGFDDVAAQFVVARDDEGFVPTAEALAAATGTELVFADGDGHGSGITNDNPDMIADLVAFADEAVGDA